MKNFKLLLLVCLVVFLSGCAVGRFTADTIDTTGKVVGAVGRATYNTGKFVYNVAATTGKMVKAVVNMSAGKKEVPLYKQGNSLFVETLLNRRQKAHLMVDTGCADTQISARLANRLGIDKFSGHPVQCVLAGGYTVTGRVVTIREVRIADVRVNNVSAVVLDEDTEIGSGRDGLLGMSFLNNFIFSIDADKGIMILERKN